MRNLTAEPRRTTKQPILAETPKLSAVGETKKTRRSKITGTGPRAHERSNLAAARRQATLEPHRPHERSRRPIPPTVRQQSKTPAQTAPSRNPTPPTQPLSGNGDRNPIGTTPPARSHPGSTLPTGTATVRQHSKTKSHSPRTLRSHKQSPTGTRRPNPRLRTLRPPSGNTATGRHRRDTVLSR